MVSPADETDSDPCDAQPDEYDVAVAVDRMQQALDIPVSRIEHRWAGLRSFTPDRGLAIGEGVERGFFWMVGQGGYGMQTAPAAGRLLAALVNGTDPGNLAAAAPLCDPRRFKPETGRMTVSLPTLRMCVPPRRGWPDASSARPCCATGTWTR